VEEGAADQSYGIQVAALAGVPPEVVARAREILNNLEAEAVDRDGRPRLARHAVGDGPGQMALFGARPEAPRLGGKAAALARERSRDRDSGQETRRQVLAALREVQAETMTPLEALQTLDRLSKRLRAAGGAVIGSSRETAVREGLEDPASPDPPATGPTHD
jgi:DNA mismatch repair protein MutS